MTNKIIALCFVVAFAVLAAELYHESRNGDGHSALLAIGAGVFTIAMAARFPD